MTRILLALLLLLAAALPATADIDNVGRQFADRANTFTAPQSFSAGLSAGARSISATGATFVTRTISSAPASSGDWNSATTCCGGDLSKTTDVTLATVTGAATLGQPTSGYLYTNETIPHVTVVENYSGWSDKPDSNAGRSGWGAYRTLIRNYGQGDVFAYNAAAFVASTRPGATHFLAQPAVALFNGTAKAGANDVYLNMEEMLCDDSGYRAACIGYVINIKRTVADRGSLGVVWMGVRPQEQQGDYAGDAAYSGSGRWKVGLDLTQVTLETASPFNRMAIAMRRDDRICLSASADSLWPGFAQACNGDWIGSATSIGGVIIAAGGAAAVQVNASQVTTTLATVMTSYTQFTPRATPSISTNGRCEISYDGATTAKLYCRNSSGVTLNGTLPTLAP